MGKHVVRRPMLMIAVMVGAVTAGGVASSGPAGGAGVRVGSSFVVAPPVARYVVDLDLREKREQVRDWAVLATVAQLGATADEAAAATYELPPARLPYLDELYTFEHGRGRRAYLGSRTLLFRDSDDPDPQATIGRLADRVREESGAIPPQVEVYVVHDQRDDGTIKVERTADVAGTALFSPAYGYVEGTAATAAELGAWLGRVDDLSFAQLAGGKLVLGGRRFAGTRTAGVTLEDVAALYQAHDQLGAPRAAARKTLQALPPAAQKLAERFVQLMRTRQTEEARKLFPQFWREARVPTKARADAIADALMATAQPAKSPGFSLDPDWKEDPSAPKQPLVLARLRALAADPCGAIDAIVRQAPALSRAEPDELRRAAPTRAALELAESAGLVFSQVGRATACNALQAFVPRLKTSITTLSAAAASSSWRTGLAGVYRLRNEIAALATPDAAAYPAWLTGLALEYYIVESQAQCARYEGTIGTEVGMTMFYTDLLAKLWMSIDYGRSAPTQAVAGFQSQPRRVLSPTLATVKGNTLTRIWFGPRAGGVSRADGAGTSLLFDHLFTRLYAAGSDPEQPDVEARPNEASRTAFGWWDRHYDDVADYEQEYHRLNQIMKWSLVAGLLSEAGTSLGLERASVRRDRDFDRWYRAQQSRLRFAGSLPISGAGAGGAECLPLLESYAFDSGAGKARITGGVGTTTREALSRVPAVNVKKPLGARKAPVQDLEESAVGTVVRPVPRLIRKDVVFDRAAGIPIRDADGDITLGTPKITYRAGANPGSIEILAGDSKHSIGSISAERRGAGITLAWRDGRIEEARQGTRTAGSLAEADKLARGGDVIAATAFYEAGGTAGAASTPLEQARAIVIDAAHRRPAAVLKALERMASRREQLAPEIRHMLTGATDEIGTLAAVAHVKHVLASQLPLATSSGRLITDRGIIQIARDIDVLAVEPRSIPPETDLSERVVYVDHRLRIGQAGAAPDLAGPAARVLGRPGVALAQLKQSPLGPHDQLVETSSGRRLERIAPTKSGPGNQLPALVLWASAAPP